MAKWIEAVGALRPSILVNPPQLIPSSLKWIFCFEISLSNTRCGGCGSKVGAQVLSRALSRVRSLMPQRSDVVTGIGGRVGTGHTFRA